jgi:predicted MFS family arabinose efflux permease
VGWTLDLGGGMSRITWAVAFFVVALLSVAALAVFWLMRPRELDGDLRG